MLSTAHQLVPISIRNVGDYTPIGTSLRLFHTICHIVHTFAKNYARDETNFTGMKQFSLGMKFWYKSMKKNCKV
jgi:hypothetical protein